MSHISKTQGSLYLTSLGIACPLGLGKSEVIEQLFAPVPRPIEMRETLISGKSVPVGRVPFEIPDLPDEHKSQSSRNNRLLRLALDEIAPEVELAKIKYGSHRVGVILGTSTSGILEGEKAFIHKQKTGNWPNEFHYLQQEIGSPSVFSAKYLDLKGPAFTISTSCSSGGKAMSSARRLINADICDVVICGGVDSLCSLTLNGFDSLELVSDKVCLPFSKNRGGITIGEGAAVFMLAAENFIGDQEIEFMGCGESSDAYHISSPDPSGAGAEVAIHKALKMASLNPEDIAYINLHGTATSLNDAMENTVTHRIFGNKVCCSSTKALTGHALGAAGAIEAAFLWLSLSQEQDGFIPLPPHIWDGVHDPELHPLKFTKPGDRAAAKNSHYALLSNSYAFGGSNSSIILGKKGRN